MERDEKEESASVKDVMLEDELEDVGNLLTNLRDDTIRAGLKDR